MGALPRGLAYLAKLLDEPKSESRLAALQRYLKARRSSSGFGHATALDRARAREYADGRRGDLTRLMRETYTVELPAAVLATILNLAIVADVTPKSVREALILIGLEAIADDLRSSGQVRSVALPSAGHGSTAGSVAALF
jgi:hypothetical protein